MQSYKLSPPTNKQLLTTTQPTPLVAVAVAGSLPVRLLQQLVTASAATAAYSPGLYGRLKTKCLYAHIFCTARCYAECYYCYSTCYSNYSHLSVRPWRWGIV